jgi:hypothetical protein
MRYLLPIPLMAIPIAIFNLLGLSEQWIDAESTWYDTVLPSQTEFYLKFGELLMAFGLVVLLIDILKARRMTVVGAALSTAVFIAALAEFLIVPFCGTTIFFFLMLMALTEALAFIILVIARSP